MSWPEQAFWALISALGIIIASCFGYVAIKMDTIADSVVELNTKIAVLIEQGEGRDRALLDHELRLRDLERQD